MKALAITLFVGALLIIAGLYISWREDQKVCIAAQTMTAETHVTVPVSCS